MNRNRNRNPGARSAGFSLTELLVALAIAGILAAVALPTYSDHIARTRRATARAALVQAAQWLERAATANGVYPLATAIPVGLLTAEGGHYGVSAETGDSTYVLKAVPAGSQTGDRCGTLVLRNSGEREISDAIPLTSADACWSR